MIKFNVESFSAQHVSGWAHDPTPAAGPVEVSFRLRDGVRSIQASLFRKHLLDAGIGDGHAGFSFHLGKSEQFDPFEPIKFESKNDKLIFNLPSTIQRALRFDSSADGFLGNQEYLFDCVLVLIIKNEAFYLEEWIEYHRLIGVDHFLIFDNESTDNLQDILAYYMQLGIVTYISWPNLAAATLAQRQTGWLEQDTAYDCAVRLLMGKAKWLGFLDVDEFVVFEDGTRGNIRDFLDSYNEPLLTLFWRLFGTSGVDTRTDDLVIERFVQRAADVSERLNKVFVRPEYVHQVINAHKIVMAGEHMTAYTTAGERAYGSDRPSASFVGATIHHYHTRSQEEFKQKVARGWPKNDDNKNINWEAHFKLHDTNEITDKSVSGLAPEVKLKIEKSRANRNQLNSFFTPNQDWLLNFRQSFMHHVEVIHQNNRHILEGYIIDLLKPNELQSFLVHDGYGRNFSSVVCDQHNDILSMNRVSHGGHGFRLEFDSSPESDTIFISNKGFLRQIRLNTIGYTRA